MDSAEKLKALALGIIVVLESDSSYLCVSYSSEHPSDLFLALVFVKIALL